MALSTMESEYMTASESIRDLIHFRNMLSQFKCFIVQEQTDVLCDNQSAIFVSNNLVNNARSKHIDIRFHFVREKIEQGIIFVKHVATHLNLADIFTKPLTTDVFVGFRNAITRW